VEGDEKDSLVKEQKRKALDDTLMEKYAAAGSGDDMGEVKMVLVVREDLKMGKGKIGAQCGHATLGAYKAVKREIEKGSKFWQKVMDAYSWKMGLHKKICLKVNSEQEL
jgi:peptidyl-tRNA hydrolase, PTH2 family